MQDLEMVKGSEPYQITKQYMQEIFKQLHPPPMTEQQIRAKQLFEIRMRLKLAHVKQAIAPIEAQESDLTERSDILEEKRR